MLIPVRCRKANKNGRFPDSDKSPNEINGTMESHLMVNGWKNKLYYGNNLDILRDYVDNESVDLVYLDPPFNGPRSVFT